MLISVWEFTVQYAKLSSLLYYFYIAITLTLLVLVVGTPIQKDIFCEWVVLKYSSYSEIFLLSLRYIYIYMKFSYSSDTEMKVYFKWFINITWLLTYIYCYALGELTITFKLENEIKTIISKYLYTRIMIIFQHEFKIFICTYY